MKFRSALIQVILSWCRYSIINDYICLDLPEDTAKEVEAPKTFFEHIVNRGNQILKDRSILYRTSIKTSEDVRLTAVKKINIMKGQRNKYLPLSKLVHLKKFSVLEVRSKLDLNEDNSQISGIIFVIHFHSCFIDNFIFRYTSRFITSISLFT